MANTNLTTLFGSIADALREKGGTTESIKASDFPTAIENLPSGGGDSNVCIDTVDIVNDIYISTGHKNFEHSLGKIPNFILMVSENFGLSGAYVWVEIYQRFDESMDWGSAVRNGSTSYKRAYSSAQYFQNVTDESFDFGYASNFTIPSGTLFIITAYIE